MALLNEEIQNQIRQVLAGMSGPVRLVMFTQGSDGTPVLECSMCADTRSLLEEVAALSDQITLEVRDFLKDEGLAQQYQIDKIPAIAILGEGGAKDYGIRMYGIPSGYEFSSLIESILLASKGQPELSPKTMQEVGRLDRPVHIQVYVTPT